MLLFWAFSCPQTSLCVLVLYLPSAPPADNPMLLQADPHTGSYFPPSLLPCCHQNLGGRLCHPQRLSPRAMSGLGHRVDTWLCCWLAACGKKPLVLVTDVDPSSVCSERWVGSERFSPQLSAPLPIRLCFSQCGSPHTAVSLPLPSQSLPVQSPHYSPPSCLELPDPYFVLPCPWGIIISVTVMIFPQ